MRLYHLRTALIGLGCLASIAAVVAATAPHAGPAVPVHAQRTQGLAVVELFQSQGCSDCPPAEANLNAIAGDPNVLALSYGVTYWDQLGWKDTFATPQFTARQWDYAHHHNRGSVWTPQVYVDGQADLVGSNRGQLDQSIAAARIVGPTVALSGSRVRVGGGRASANGATVWLVRYDPRTLNVPIHAGENGGRTLPHRNIVRELVKLGSWTGTEAVYAIPSSNQPGLALAVLVQDGVGGAIVGAAKG